MVHRILEDGFRGLEEAYVQEVLDSHAADLTEEGFEQLTGLGEPGDEERPQMAVYVSLFFLTRRRLSLPANWT